MIRRAQTGALALLLLSASLSAQAPAPTAGSILAAMREASGGNAWNDVRSLHYVGTSSAGGQQTEVAHWEDMLTGRYAVRETLEGRVSAQGFDGVSLWRQGRSGIAYSLGDVDSTLVAADESFRVSRGWWFPDRHAATIAYAGTETERGRKVDVLKITPEGGRAFEAWIDHDTHLLARTIEQQAEDRVVTDYSDYRRVSGVMIPFTIRTDDDVEMVRSVDVNPEIADATYDIPPIPPSDVDLPAGQDSVDIPFRLTGDNRILLPLTIDGQTTDAEFDSGGSLILQPALMAKLQIEASGQWKQSGGGEGTIVSSKGALPSIRIGGAAIHDIGFHSFAFSPDHPEEALVGQEVLQRFVVRLDFDRSIMTLTRPDAFSYRGKGSVIPFHFQDNQPEIKGSIDGIEGLFAIDTGDNGSLLLIAPFARRYGLVARYRGDIPYDGRSVSATHGVWARRRVHTFAFDGPDGRPSIEAHDPVTRISLQHSGFDANRNVSGNIGMGILRQFNITFDYPRQRFILEPNHLFGQPDIFNRSGLALKNADRTWTIKAVYPDSPASEAGLMAGDVLVSLNGEAASSLDRDRLSSLVKGPVGTRLHFVVASAGANRSVDLTLRDIL